MAEFVDVIRQFHRMCKSNAGCVICPLRGKEGCSINAFVNNPERIEGEVMSWAAMHPEPVYPTFGEWLEKQGIVKLVNSDRYEKDGRKVYMLLESVENQIPADIAQKLGVEPKEGT